MGKKKHKTVPQGIHDAEFCGMLDGVASTVKAVYQKEWYDQAFGVACTIFLILLSQRR